jgi:hypothetical protein
MAAPQRFTGANTRIDFAGVTVSNDYTELLIDLEMQVEESTAGSDTDASYNTTVKKGKATLKLFDTGESGTAVAIALRVGTRGNLTVWPKGIMTGRPVLSFAAIVIHYKELFKSDKNTMIEIEFVKTGAMLSDVGSLQ